MQRHCTWQVNVLVCFRKTSVYWIYADMTLTMVHTYSIHAPMIWEQLGVQYIAQGLCVVWPTGSHSQGSTFIQSTQLFQLKYPVASAALQPLLRALHIHLSICLFLLSVLKMPETCLSLEVLLAFNVLHFL